MLASSDFSIVYWSLHFFLLFLHRSLSGFLIDSFLFDEPCYSDPFLRYGQLYSSTYFGQGSTKLPNLVVEDFPLQGNSRFGNTSQSTILVAWSRWASINFQSLLLFYYRACVWTTFARTLFQKGNDSTTSKILLLMTELSLFFFSISQS